MNKYIGWVKIIWIRWINLAGFYTLIKELKLDRSSEDQLRRAALSIPLNIAEGSERFGKRDRRHFFIIASSPQFEVVAILDILNKRRESS